MNEYVVGTQLGQSSHISVADVRWRTFSNVAWVSDRLPKLTRCKPALPTLTVDRYIDYISKHTDSEYEVESILGFDIFGEISCAATSRITTKVIVSIYIVVSHMTEMRLRVLWQQHTLSERSKYSPCFKMMSSIKRINCGECAGWLADVLLLYFKSLSPSLPSPIVHPSNIDGPCYLSGRLLLYCYSEVWSKCNS